MVERLQFILTLTLTLPNPKPNPNQAAMVERLQFICKEEGIHCPPAVLAELI